MNNPLLATQPRPTRRSSIRRWRWLSLGVVLLVLLALSACETLGLEDDDDEAGDDDADDAGAEIIDIDEEPGNLELAAVSFDTTGAPGVVLDPVETDVWSVQQIENAYFMTLEYPASDILITIENIPVDVETRSYPLGTTVADGGVDATLWLGPGGDTEWFGRATDGSLNIVEYEDGRITGTFTFDATQTLDDGESQTTITVLGRFTNMPLP